MVSDGKSDVQGHWYWCQLMSHIQFLIGALELKFKIGHMNDSSYTAPIRGKVGDPKATCLQIYTTRASSVPEI